MTLEQKIDNVLTEYNFDRISFDEAKKQIILLNAESFELMFDKMNDNDIQECVNGFALRVFDRINNSCRYSIRENIKKNYGEILKKAKITGVKSYKRIYGTKANVFAKYSQGYPDSSWYCEIQEDGKIVINTKYYSYPQSVIDYNNSIGINILKLKL